jgi:hypothetical protein
VRTSASAASVKVESSSTAGRTTACLRGAPAAVERLPVEVRAERRVRGARERVQPLPSLAGVLREQLRREPVDEGGQAVRGPHRARLHDLAAVRRREERGGDGDAAPAADGLAEDEPTGPDARRDADRVGGDDVRVAAPRRAPPGRQHRARVHGAEPADPPDLGGEQVHHPLAQVVQRRVGARDAERRDGDRVRADRRRRTARAPPGRADAEDGQQDARERRDPGPDAAARAWGWCRGRPRRRADRVEQPQHVVGRPRALVGRLGEEPHHEGGERRGRVGPLGGDVRRRLCDVCRDLRLRGPVGVGWPAGEQLPGDDAERVQVHAVVGGGVGERLLGRHVGRRAERDADGGEPLARGDRGRDRLRDAEVGDHGGAARQQHVLGLDVAVHHAVGVRVRQRAATSRSTRTASATGAAPRASRSRSDAPSTNGIV